MYAAHGTATTFNIVSQYNERNEREHNHGFFLSQEAFIDRNIFGGATHPCSFSNVIYQGWNNINFATNRNNEQWHINHFPFSTRFSNTTNMLALTYYFLHHNAEAEDHKLLSSSPPHKSATESGLFRWTQHTSYINTKFHFFYEASHIMSKLTKASHREECSHVNITYGNVLLPMMIILIHRFFSIH